MNDFLSLNKHIGMLRFQPDRAKLSQKAIFSSLSDSSQFEDKLSNPSSRVHEMGKFRFIAIPPERFPHWTLMRGDRYEVNDVAAGPGEAPAAIMAGIIGWTATTSSIDGD